MLLYCVVLVLTLSSFVIVAINFLKVRKNIKSTQLQLIKAFDSDREQLSANLYKSVQSLSTTLTSEAVHLEDEKVSTWNKRIETFKEFISQTSYKLYPDFIYNGNIYEAILDLSNFVSNSQTSVEATIESRDFNSTASDGNQIFKIITELLTNILKHDKTEKISVNVMTTNQELRVVFKYKTKSGSVPKFKPKQGSMGLDIIEQRLSYLKGSLKREFNGTDSIVTLTIPSTKM